MAKVLIVTEYSDSSQNSTGYYWSKINERLEREGFDVGLASPEKLVKYESSKSNPGMGQKLIKQIRVTIEIAVKILAKSNRETVVFSGTNPIILLSILPWLKKLKNFKWIILVHDVFPENLAVAKKINGQNLFYKLLSKYYSWVYSVPEKVICIGRDMQKIISGKTGRTTNIFYSSNWVDENDVREIRRSEVGLFEELGWKNKVVFQFFGNIGPIQGIDNILSGIKKTTAKNSGFVFIGGGAYVSKIKKFIEDNPEKDVKYLGSIPLERKSEGLAFCDIAMVSLETGMLGLGVPSKTYFSLAAGKPILAIVDRRSEIAMLIDEHPVGWWCGQESPEMLSELIDSICLNPAEIHKMKPREVFERYYTGSESLGRIVEIIQGQFAEM
jgi:glycosyltransferase involved in cell wall biosynthesis